MKRFHRFDLLKIWFAEYQTVNGYSSRTIHDYGVELGVFRRWLDEETAIEDIADITAEMLRSYVTMLYRLQRAPATINYKLSVLNTFFGTLYEEDKLYIDLRTPLPRTRQRKSLPKGILTEAEMKRVVAYIDAVFENTKVNSLQDAILLRECAIVDLFYATGMRRNELTALKRADLDLEEGTVFIRSGKGDKDRVVPFGKTTATILKSYLTTARPYFTPEPTADYLFIAHHGGRFTDNVIRKSVITVMQGAGITRHIKVHTLRHTCATHLLNHGADIRYVQELLGHASLNSTQVYTHVAINKLKETHQKFHPRERGDYA